MPIRRALIAFFLSASVSLGAEELTTLSGQKIEGQLVSVSNKEVVMLNKAGQRVTTPIDQVLVLSLAPVPRLTAADKFTDVRLTDDTLLHCAKVEIKGKEVLVRLLGGAEVKAPLEAVRYIMNDAQDDKVQKEWEQRRYVRDRRSHDLVIVKSDEGQLNGLEGTLGAVDEEKKTIEFEPKGAGKKYPLALDKAAGMVFLRGAEVKLDPLVCKLYDLSGNVLMVSSVEEKPDGFTFTTAGGVKIDCSRKLVAKLDYSRGKLTFLSDEDEFWRRGRVKVIQSNTEDRIEKPRINKNLDDGPLRLGGITYAQGLALHSRTELEFDLGGDYREFSAVIGMDDLVGGNGPTVIKIEADGQEIYKQTFNRTVKPEKIVRSVKDAKVLKITVYSEQLLDLGKHIDLADAKVQK